MGCPFIVGTRCCISLNLVSELIMCHTVTKVGFEDLDITLMEDETTYVNVTFDRTLEKPIFVNYSLMSIGET